jgi:hypothetical protein
MANSEILFRGRLKGYKRMQMYKLLDMLYKPSEISAEVGFTQRQVYRVYIPAGCPHERDDRGHLWINGKMFREWYEITYPRMEMKSNEAFCLTCKKPVKMANPLKVKKGRFVYWKAACSACGRKLVRIISNKRDD